MATVWSAALQYQLWIGSKCNLFLSFSLFGRGLEHLTLSISVTRTITLLTKYHLLTTICGMFVEGIQQGDDRAKQDGTSAIWSKDIYAWNLNLDVLNPIFLIYIYMKTSARNVNPPNTT